ncbi:monovalent cation/H+ antiporter subunit A [Sinimarinibacterium sp. NLF-5-8]|uniref:monovalent cation/H+ antiporter subunit A n=1 Tax=Sinimarinibacterium sp. NLF-5-8 TaxID=2698684 RepID=UPI00137BB68D|nr:monovalent cation/H+ antiporter subunit A [Sinimarinibacterium sp. NLF-5-8]QHS10840.1 monovalent cation/H+ antiporter subunit A [Sinimarinibacterium sp. NLF-5-8]
MTLLLILILPILGSVCAALQPANARNAEAWLSGLIALTCTALVISLYPQVANEGVVRLTIAWLPSLGLDFYLRMDGFAWLFALLISGIGALVVLYARYYMSAEDPVPRFFSFLLAFMAAMLGVVLSGNVLQLVFFWELTSLSSFMLIAYWHHRVDARRGARMAMIVTVSGGLCLLAGMLLLGHMAGGYTLEAIFAAADQIKAHPWYPPMLILVALGALTKSAQFPFHFWLPHAMAAPTPVSAYLHSATMVKAGVFLLARLWPALAGTDLWFGLIGGAGLATLLLGAYAALYQQDMKGILAYSTISHLGLITLLLGMNSTLALVAAVFHIVNHATFKASLFMATGIVDHETGTRDVGRLSGLRRAMPLTATLATVAAAAMAGVPLLNGFLSKEMFFQEIVLFSGRPSLALGLPLAAVLAGTFSVAYSLRFIHQVFFGRPATDLPLTPHEPPRWMLLPSALLVLACVLVGSVPGLTVAPLLETVTRSILGADTPHYSLAIWHGFNLPLAMSLIALVGGIALYRVLLVLHRRAARRASGVQGYHQPWLFRIDGRSVFDVTLNSIKAAAEALVQRASTRRLQPQLFVLVVLCLVAVGMSLSGTAESAWRLPATPLNPAFALLWIVGAACAMGAARQAKYHRLAALMLSGGAGLCTCLTFVWLSAPDLALTQLAIEVVTVVLLLLGLRWLPRRIESDADRQRTALRTRWRRRRDFALAGLGGAGMAALTYLMLSRPAIVDGVAAYFVEAALPLGGGRNIVNVILVDFRGFDTMGEITVVGVVALTVFALLRRFRPAPESMELPRQQQQQGIAPIPTGEDVAVPGYRVVPTAVLRLLLPIAGLISVFVLLKGHNQPGGGFVGGLILATGALLQYMVGGIVWVEKRTLIHPQTWMAAGLICAGGAGLLALAIDAPFLSSAAVDLPLPLLGPVHLSSVLLFDLGVYLLVAGATILMLVAIAHQTLRSHHYHFHRLEQQAQRQPVPGGE